jgi:hypothetical protein
MRALVLLSVSATVLRDVGDGSRLKIKGEAAAMLFAGLSGAERCGPRGCKRRGEDVICSTKNLRDPVVCEVRLDASGAVVPVSGWRLYHSVRDNRVHGTARWDGEALSLSGPGLGMLWVVDVGVGRLSWSAP